MKTLLTLQLTIFILVAVGFLMKKIHIIGPQGQKNINDLVIYLILPCNILHAFTQSAADEDFSNYLASCLSQSVFRYSASFMEKSCFARNPKIDGNACSMELSAQMQDFLEIRSQKVFMGWKVLFLPVYI